MDFHPFKWFLNGTSLLLNSFFFKTKLIFNGFQWFSLIFTVMSNG